MALIGCPDCVREFSDQAKACPNCGRPFSLGQRSLLKTEVGVEGLLFGLMIIIGLMVIGLPYGWLMAAAGVVLLVLKLLR